MYESPIELFSVTDYAKQVDEQIENTVYKAIIKVGVNVDREELIKALAYDRNQYEKGYADGKRDGIEWHPYPKEKPQESQGWYFVTWINEKDETVTGSDCYWYHDGWKWFRGRVTAWAYLPDPYEEGAEG